MKKIIYTDGRVEYEGTAEELAELEKDRPRKDESKKKGRRVLNEKRETKHGTLLEQLRDLTPEQVKEHLDRFIKSEECQELVRRFAEEKRRAEIKTMPLFPWPYDYPVYPWTLRPVDDLHGDPFPHEPIPMYPKITWIIDTVTGTSAKLPEFTVVNFGDATSKLNC